jgi:putative transposase
VITDKLRSYFKPIRSLEPDSNHRAHKGLNNTIEGLHQPTQSEKNTGTFQIVPARATIYIRAQSN